MRFGLNVANLGEYSDPRLHAELAREAESAGWDGYFVWDMLLFDRGTTYPIVDPWIALSAVAMSTTHIRIGALGVSLPRRRPWKVAREAVSLDHLSGGRLVLGVTQGFQPEADFAPFGEEMDLKTRAQMLDEALEILAGLWSGEPFAFTGRHYKVQEVTFLPRPMQQPRIPVWLTGMWPNPRPFLRAARWDGVFPAGPGGDWMQPHHIIEVAQFVKKHRHADEPFDIAYFGNYGSSPGDDPQRAAEIVRPWREAGLTWWLESIDPWRGTLDEVRTRIRQGPPRIAWHP